MFVAHTPCISRVPPCLQPLFWKAKGWSWRKGSAGLGRACDSGLSKNQQKKLGIGGYSASITQAPPLLSPGTEPWAEAQRRCHHPDSAFNGSEQATSLYRAVVSLLFASHHGLCVAAMRSGKQNVWVNRSQGSESLLLRACRFLSGGSRQMVLKRVST